MTFPWPHHEIFPNCLRSVKFLCNFHSVSPMCTNSFYCHFSVTARLLIFFFVLLFLFKQNTHNITDSSFLRSSWKSPRLLARFLMTSWPPWQPRLSDSAKTPRQWKPHNSKRQHEKPNNKTEQKLKPSLIKSSSIIHSHRIWHRYLNQLLSMLHWRHNAHLQAGTSDWPQWFVIIANLIYQKNGQQNGRPCVLAAH